MTMIELLVQELPKHGGWPSWALEACNQNMGRVMFYNSDGGIDGDSPEIFIGSSDDQSITEEVTRHQYETALAASERVGWNGFGVPPVGQKCKRSAFGDDWAECEVLYVGPEVIVVSVEGREKAYKTGSVKFHPLLTEAERKRDEAKDAIAELCRSSASNGHSADLIYDAIAAGKIPHITLN
ncbi:MAG: hypothetical protein ACJ8LD_19825 [Pantoea agglomerans]